MPCGRRAWRPAIAKCRYPPSRGWLSGRGRRARLPRDRIRENHDNNGRNHERGQFQELHRMKVAVLGGGVIGVTTAYYLVMAGHEVELFDRRADVAEETSFANAGQVSPGYSSPWAGPGIPLKALKWLAMRHGPLSIRPTLDIKMWRWMLEMLRNCTADRYALNKSRMVPLAEYSRDCLRQLRRKTGIEYDQKNQGTLQLFRTRRQLDGVARDVEVLQRLGVPHQVLSEKECLLTEPGLSASTVPLAGGLRLPDDETGDCRMFTRELAELAGREGVRFRLNSEVTGIATDGHKVSGVVHGGIIRMFDACVVALGSWSPALLAPLGIMIPVYPVKGYSLTIPVADPEFAPVSTVMDETYKTAITRLGGRIRVGGTAELAGFDQRLRSGRRAALEHSFGQLFPAGGDMRAAMFWTGLRPMTPDGPPLVGPTGIDGLYLNTGHGTLGWTMACGSASALADLVSGREPLIDMRSLSIRRYRT
ncbi:D-amino acid dehydrogenase [Oricola nitratireducens]|uniref:D-amino acid dehydrogenase n=1 Tax=Oricola nitratireducens TaxID=2775868 RepID=UPI0031BAD119